MHAQRTFVAELQPAGQMAARAAHPFGDGVELSAFERKERKDAIGFAQLPPAQYDSPRLIGAWLRR
jgi:nitrous oxide reductase accessory protein NosL